MMYKPNKLVGIVLLAILAIFVIYIAIHRMDEALATESSKGKLPPSVSSDDLLTLLLASRSVKTAKGQGLDKVLRRNIARVPRNDPQWPIYTFLLGEVYQLQKKPIEAQNMFRRLTEWAKEKGYEDGWGGSGLAAISLWRWLEGLKQSLQVNAKEVSKALECGDILLKTRLFGGMVQLERVLPTLPQLEEEILRHLASLAWLIGQKDRAMRYFLDYLTIASADKFDHVEREIYDEIINSGLASVERLALNRGVRLAHLKKNEAAAKQLSKASNSSDPQVRIEAKFYYAKFLRKQIPQGKPLELLTDVLEHAADPKLAQEALFLRAKVYDQAGSKNSLQKFRIDLKRLLKEYPRGVWADDALYQLAASYQSAGELDISLMYYEKLRKFKGPNDRADSAAFKPAMALISRENPGDLEEASKLLKILAKSPYNPFFLHSLFWLGRIAEMTGDQQKAAQYFKQIIKERPYDYYAIRARIHLANGTKGSEVVLPISEKTKSELRQAYRNSKVERSLSSDTVYHQRLLLAIESGLYQEAMKSEQILRTRLPSMRLSAVPLKILDKELLLSSLGVMLAIRQDGMAAIEKVRTTENRLKIAGTVGQRAKDFQFAMKLTIHQPMGYQRKIQQDFRYLATAYPRIYLDEITFASSNYNVRPALLYSVMRQESLFYSSALSVENALGLFQFTPGTFSDLVAKGEVRDRESYLLDKQRSINLGAKWFKRLLRKFGGNPVLAVMAHQGGPNAVKGWVKMVKALGKEKDIEFTIETARKVATRNFTRSVLADLTIVDAAGILRH